MINFYDMDNQKEKFSFKRVFLAVVVFVGILIILFVGAIYIAFEGPNAFRNIDTPANMQRGQ